MKARLFSILLLVLFLTAGCGEVPTAQPPAGQSPVPPPTVESYPLAPTWTPRPPRPTATSTSVPTPSPTRTPRPTPLVVQPTPFMPQEPLPETFPVVIYAVKRPDESPQIWTLQYQEGALEEQLLIHLSEEVLVNRLGGGYYRLLRSSTLTNLSVSPSGRYVGISLGSLSEIQYTSIVIDTTDGSLFHSPHPTLGGGWIQTWISPTDRLVLVSAAGGAFWSINVDGTDFVQFPIGTVMDATALPRENRILFASSLSAGMLIGVVDVDGNNLVPFPSPDPARSSWVLNLSISPDGTACAFTLVDLNAPGPPIGGQVWVMNVDGTQQRPLGNEEDFDLHLAWSPNGAEIAFAHWDGDDATLRQQSAYVRNMPLSLRVMDVESAEERVLVPSEGRYAHWSPRWLPDGSGLVFLSNRGGETNIWFIRADGTGLQQLTRQGGLAGEIALWMR